MYVSRLCLPENAEERVRLAVHSSMESFKIVVDRLRERYLPYHEGKLVWRIECDDADYNLKLPPWLCQSYVRSSPEEHMNKIQAKQEAMVRYPIYISNEIFDLR